MKLNTLSLTAAIQKLKQKEFSIDELYEDVEDAIRSSVDCNIYLSLDKEARLKAKKRINMMLAGMPIAVKDNFCTKELPTTASAKLLEGFIPAYESTVTDRMQKNGGVIIGKTNMDAWAHGSSTETSDYGVTKNPRNKQFLPGGSSGGSAAAVAAECCMGAIGSETAGSIRQPAAWCGVVGLKPTYGRVPRTGVIAMGSSLDCPGPIGKTVEDTVLLLQSIAGHDPYDATTAKKPLPSFASMKQGVKGMKIGICYIDHELLKTTEAAAYVRESAKMMESLGAMIDFVPLSQQLTKGHILTPDYAIAVYTIIQRGEVSSNLSRYDGIRYGMLRDTFGAEAKRRIMLGTFTLSNTISKGDDNWLYRKAQQVRDLYIRNFHDLFSTYDVLLSPSSPGYAQKLGATAGNPMFGELEDMLFEPSSISGLPGINVPSYRNPETNLYLGLNIIADQWEEEKMIRVAYAYEQTRKIA